MKKFTVEETDLPKTHFSREFMMDLMSFPDQVRNIALVGHLHHGKTAFMDMLVLETHDLGANTEGKKGEQVTVFTGESYIVLEANNGHSFDTQIPTSLSASAESPLNRPPCPSSSSPQKANPALST